MLSSQPNHIIRWHIECSQYMLELYWEQNLAYQQADAFHSQHKHRLLRYIGMIAEANDQLAFPLDLHEIHPIKQLRWLSH